MAIASLWSACVEAHHRLQYLLRMEHYTVWSSQSRICLLEGMPLQVCRMPRLTINWTVGLATLMCIRASDVQAWHVWMHLHMVHMSIEWVWYLAKESTGAWQLETNFDKTECIAAGQLTGSCKETQQPFNRYAMKISVRSLHALEFGKHANQTLLNMLCPARSNNLIIHMWRQCKQLTVWPLKPCMLHIITGSMAQCCVASSYCHSLWSL